MAETLDIGKDQAISESQGAVANLTNSAPKDKKPTGATSSPKRAARPGIPTTPVDVAAVARTLLNYAEEAGMDALIGKKDGRVWIGINGLDIDAEDQIVAA